MEIYKDLSNPKSKEFEQLLNNQLSKITIEEGKIIEGKINKITEKFVFLYIEGLKSEPVLDINELKHMGLEKNIKIGEKISVLLEKIEDKNGEVIVSASKALKKYQRFQKKCGVIMGEYFLNILTFPILEMVILINILKLKIKKN